MRLIKLPIQNFDMQFQLVIVNCYEGNYVYTKRKLQIYQSWQKYKTD